MSGAPDRAGPASLRPSGRQFRLRCGDQEATVTEVGASLRSLRVGERELLDGYGADERCSDGRGQLFAPWPNRLAGGRYRFGDTWHQLPLSEPGQDNAIHGLVRWLPWTLEEGTERSVRLAVAVPPQPGYDFSLTVRAEYRLGESGLSVALEGLNTGNAPLPFGAGAHPYLSLGNPRVDELHLAVPARTRLELDERGIPTGVRQPVAGGPFDFREGRVLGPLQLDCALTDLERDQEGLAWVRVRRPDEPGELALWLDRAMPYLMLFTGDSLPDPRRRRRGLGVEPMSCAPNAFGSGDGLAVLEPGRSFRCSWGMRFCPLPPAGKELVWPRLSAAPPPGGVPPWSSGSGP